MKIHVEIEVRVEPDPDEENPEYLVVEVNEVRVDGEEVFEKTDIYCDGQFWPLKVIECGYRNQELVTLGLDVAHAIKSEEATQ